MKDAELQAELSTLKLREQRLVEALKKLYADWSDFVAYINHKKSSPESTQPPSIWYRSIPDKLKDDAQFREALSQTPATLKAEWEAVERVIEAVKKLWKPTPEERRGWNDEDLFNAAFENLSTELSNLQKVRGV